MRRWGERTRVSTSVKDWNDRVLDVYRSFTVSDTPPSAPSVGQGWQTTLGARLVWSGSAWTPISPLENNPGLLLIADAFGADVMLDSVEVN